jgi:hypothetical protein
VLTTLAETLGRRGGAGRARFGVASSNNLFHNLELTFPAGQEVSAGGNPLASLGASSPFIFPHPPFTRVCPY